MLTTLERYKTYYEIEDNDLDAQIQMAIEQVSVEIESICNRSFAETEYNVIIRGSGTEELILGEYPVKEATIANFTDFIINKKTGILISNSVWSPNIKYNITFTAGYVLPAEGVTSTVPVDLEKACIVMASMDLERRGSEHLKTEVIGPLRNDFAVNVPDVLEKYRKIAI